MPEEIDAITRFVQACEPNQSLEPNDQRYVNCDDVRGSSRIEEYERGLRRSAVERPDFILFTGHRGVGKTSELLRLRQRLQRNEAGKRPFKVIYFDVTDALDPNDLDFPDLLVLTAAQVQAQLGAAAIPGIGVVNGYMQRVWDEIKTSLAGEVILKDAEIGTPYAKLALELRNRPNARRNLRAAIEQHSTNLLGAVNDLLMDSTQKLRAANYEGLVLIIDGLDKLVLRPLDEGKSNTHLRLFCDRAEQLTSLKAHTIYTVPISLIYSPRCSELEQSFGIHVAPIPMIRLRGENKGAISPETIGMQKMQEMIAARCKFANVDYKQLFDERSTGDFICEMTGGHPRHLVMFLQAAANSLDKLPITRAAAERAVSNYANSLAREIPTTFWKQLRKFATPQVDIEKNMDHQEMLFLLHIFEYMNGSPWYEVNPVVRRLPKFSESV
jgi:hypothetical protein